MGGCPQHSNPMTGAVIHVIEKVNQQQEASPGSDADFLGILVDGTIGRIVMDTSTDRRTLLAATRDYVVTALTV